MDHTLDEFLKVENSRKGGRRYYKRPRTPIEYRHNIMVPLSPEAVDRLGILPGLDAVEETIEGNQIILRFHRKGAAET